MNALWSHLPIILVNDECVSVFHAHVKLSEVLSSIIIIIIIEMDDEDIAI